MNIAIVLVHNKTDAENQAQIEFLKSLINKVTDTFPVYDDQGKQTGTDESYHYEILNLGLPHELKVYQIIPFGITQPSNFYDIDTHNVIYRKGDEDKIGDHPRFFNWGLKRGTDYGAEFVIHLDDYKSFSIDDLAVQLNTLADPTDKTEFVDGVSSNISTLKLLKEVGQLDEGRSLSEAITDLKSEISKSSLKVLEVLDG